MIMSLVFGGIKNGKTRFACAVLGIAVSAGSVVFMSSLVATNRAQGPLLAKQASAPWAAWRTDAIQGGRGGPGRPGRPGGADRPAGRPGGERRPDGAGRHGGEGRPDLRLRAVVLDVDYREGGRVLQGPPMRVTLSDDPGESPYSTVALSEGRWIDADAAEPEIVCVRSAMRRFGRGKEPEIGSLVVFTLRGGGTGAPGMSVSGGGERGARGPGKGYVKLTARLVGYMDGGKLPSMFPTVFANKSAVETLPRDAFGSIAFWKNVPETADGTILTPESDAVVRGFTGDEQRRMDYATPLLVAASVLTALALLAVSLLLSVESNRKTLANLRTAGLTRCGAVGFVLAESMLSGAAGWVLGTLCAMVALAVYVASDSAAFPAGVAYSWGRIGVTLAVLPFVVACAVLFALAPVLKVRGMDASAARPRKHRWGMAVTFALGFAAFVAVEVWGASLMRSFVPSPEWPDAVVSILPAGVRSSERVLGPMRKIDGVKRISELYPFQAFLAGSRENPGAPSARPSRFGAPNILFLASEWLPEFKYVEGSHEECEKLWRDGKGVVISEITSRANGLHKGDLISVEIKGRRGGPPAVVEIPVAGVADINWHMVTSRGLVRGLNGMPGSTEGPAFISFDALAELDPASMSVGPSLDAANPEAPGEGEKPMTHLWVEYEKDFLAKHGVFQAGRLIERAIDESLGHPKNSTVQLHARDEIADGTLAHGSDVIGQAARVPFVFLAILSIGFVSMLVGEAEASKREFAVLRAVGSTRFDMAARLAFSAVKTALLGILFGIPAGSLAGWIASINTGAMFRGLPHWFVLPAGIVAEGALGALVFALLFAVPASILIVVKSTRR